MISSSMSSGATDDYGIGAALDALPLGRTRRAILALCALGLMFDVVELGLSNALSAVFSAPPLQVAPLRLSLLLAAVFIGGAIGTPVLGWLADRHGRRIVLGGALIALAATSLLAAASPDIAWLTFFRILSGAALGAYPPLMVAYLSDVLPPARRGALILLCGGVGFLAAPAVIFVIRWLTPLQPLGLEGWRWALLLGALGAAIVGALFFVLPESARWLAAKGRHAEAEQALARIGAAAAPQRDADDRAPSAAAVRFWSLAGGTYRRRALLLAAMYFLAAWATVGFPVLSGAVLIEKGFRLADSLLVLGLSMFGPSLGALLGAVVIDRVERRTALALCGSAMALIGLAFAASGALLALVALGFVFTVVGTVYVAALSIYDAELFPTAMRAAVSSATWTVNRIASAVVPLTLLPLLKAFGSLAMFAVVAGAMAASVVLVMMFGVRGFARRPLQ